MITQVVPLPSSPTVNFLEVLATNAASAMNNISGLAPSIPFWWIAGVTVLTQQNFAPEFNFFKSASGPQVGVAADTWLGRIGFTQAQGEQIATTGLWRYVSLLPVGTAIPYWDADRQLTQNPPQLHVVLQNTGATTKSAGAPGAIAVTFWMQPQMWVQG